MSTYSLFNVLSSKWFRGCQSCQVVSKPGFNDVQICPPHRKRLTKAKALVKRLRNSCYTQHPPRGCLGCDALRLKKAKQGGAL